MAAGEPADNALNGPASSQPDFVQLRAIFVGVDCKSVFGKLIGRQKVLTMLRFSLAKQIGFLLLVPACSSLLGFATLYATFSQSDDDSRLTIRAGHLRDLSTELPGYVHMVHSGEDED
ncbi:MAG: hypothetical protein ABI960_00485 [Candidatus Eisenbacteria bacterium]